MEPRLSQYLHQKGRLLGLPINGTFELTARCNFDCKMCYVHLSRQEQERRGRELTADEWLTLADRARAEGMVFLLLTGGEPTLRQDFPDIYTELKKMGFYLSINSNGRLLEGELAELLKRDPPNRVNISLYGTDNGTYERLCGQPVYDRILRNIRTLREAGIPVKINMTLTPDNAADMQSIYETSKLLDAQIQATPYMFPPIRLDPNAIGKSYRVDPMEGARLRADFDRLTLTPDAYRRKAAAFREGRIVQEAEACGEEVEGTGMTCRAGITSFWLTWDGKMMPCGQMIEPAVDVLKLGFRDAWAQIRQATQAIRLPAQCAACGYRHLCRPCAAMCYCETGRFDGKPEYVCEMNRRYAELTESYCRKFYGGNDGTET